ncbi:Eukaryotic translation initiation factor 4 gamma [Blomia tropicalis]|nr:Eukaryotic translation initiation factor 4 gamma [Blomia tropicalis]
MSSKPLQKPRPGGGQSQSNQRQQPAAEYSRSERSNYQSRQGNTVHSVPPNSIPQVNMHPQHPQAPTPQVIQTQTQLMRPYHGHQQPPNQQTLVPQQPIQVGNTVQQPPNVQSHMIRNSGPYAHGYQHIQNANRLPMAGQHRPQYNHHRNTNAVAGQQIQNMQTQQGNLYIMHHGMSPNMYTPLPPHTFMNHYHMPPNILLQDSYSVQPQIRQFQPQTQPINIPNNMQPNEMINQLNQYQQQQQQQPPHQAATQQPATKLEPKREKKLLQIFNEDGTEVNLAEVAKQKQNSIPNEKNPNSEQDVIIEPVNGIGIDKEEDLKTSPIVDDVKVEQELKVEKPSTNEVEVTADNTNVTNEQSNVEVKAEPVDDGPVDDGIQCDNGTLAEPSSVEVLEVKKETNNDLNQIVDKVANIVLNDPTTPTKTTTTTTTKPNDVIVDDQNLATVQDQPNPISEPSISGDKMESDTNVKCVEQPKQSVIEHNGSGVLSSNDQTSIQPNSDESMTTTETKDDDEHDKNHELSDQQDNTSLSRNSSQNGPRVYDSEFLRSLRNQASDYAVEISNQDNIREIIKRNDNNKVPSHDMFIPNFANQGRQMQNDYRNKSQQGIRRISQPSKNFNDKSRKIASTSLMNEYYGNNENAWKPGKLASDDPVEMETEKLLKNVRAILNKLTPQNYQTLLEQFKKLEVDTRDRLTRIIDLIFEKAVKEPAFVVQYAGFCAQLAHISVTSDPGENGEVKKIGFKYLLIRKCEQTFFSGMYADIENLDERVKEIEDCSDEAKMKALEEILDDDKRLSRKRAVGNIKLIAELYKLNMLSVNIMFSCFETLLRYQHEDYIECLCALITNIGKNFTEAIKDKQDKKDIHLFEKIMSKLKQIYEQKEELKVSSRIRFMILDLLDLKDNRWVPRRKAEGPKTIAQVHRDMEEEARQKAIELNEMKRRKQLDMNQSQDEWQQVTNKRKSNNNIPPKLVNLNAMKDALNATKSSSSKFGQFAMGSHGGSNSQSRSSSSNYENKYQALSGEKNARSHSTFHDSLNASVQSLRRDERKTSDVTNYYQSNRDGSLPNSRNSSMHSEIIDSKSDIDISKEAFEKETADLFNEYISKHDFNQALQNLVKFCSKSRFHLFVYKSLTIALEKHIDTRHIWGEFLAQMFLQPIYPCLEIFEGLKCSFSNYQDLDLPKYWEFVGEIIGLILVKVYEADSSRSKDVFREVSKALGEVAGKDYLRLTNSVKQTINDKIENRLASEIIAQLQPSAGHQLNAKNDIRQPNDNVESKAIEFLDKYLKSNSNISTLEKEFSVTEPSFIRALFYQIFKRITEHSAKFELNSRQIDILVHYVKDQKTQIELLMIVCELWNDLNKPHDFLPRLFQLLHNENLIDKSAYREWSNDKRTNGAASAAVTRFFKTVLQI